MSLERDRSYDRKLEDVLVARLRQGQPPEHLLAELKNRLDDAQADTLLSRAEARVRTQQSPNVATRIFAGAAYAWTVVLILQNIGVLYAANSAPPGDPTGAAMTGLALLKIALLCAGMFAFKRWRSVLTAGLYAVAVVYAFPLGLVVDPLFLVHAVVIDPIAPVTSVSALLSYATVVFIGLAWWQSRPRRSPQAVETFD